MKWPRRKGSELVLYTDRNGFTHFRDQINPLASASWDPMNSLPNNEAARRLRALAFVQGSYHNKSERGLGPCLAHFW